MGIIDSFVEWRKLGLRIPSATDYEEHSAVGDLSTGRRFKAVQAVPMKCMNATNASLTFYGFTKPGSATSDALWRIIAEDALGNTSFADGNDLFDNVWDNRGTYVYT